MKRTRHIGLTVFAAGALMFGMLHGGEGVGFASSAHAQPGGQGGSGGGSGSAGGGGGRGGGAGEGPGAGSSSASESNRSGGAGAPGMATSAVARNPGTRGVAKALSVVETTPAAESEAPQTLPEALSRWLKRGEDGEEEEAVQ